MLLLITAIQLGMTLWSTRDPVLQVWKTIGKNATWRGVNFSAGWKMADFVTFLNGAVPEDGRVIIPPDGTGPPALGKTPYMQFFLAPRQVINCNPVVETCVLDYASNDTYIVSVPDENFPDESLQHASDRTTFQYLPFNKDLGLYLPGDWTPAQANRADNYSSLFEIGLSLLLPVLWLLSLTWAGSLLVIRLASIRLGRLVTISLGLGVGTGGFTLLLYLFMLTGIRLNKAWVFGITALWLMTCLLIYLFVIAGNRAIIHVSPLRFRLSSREIFRPETIYLVAFCLIALVSLIMAIGRAYHASDEVVLWGLKGYGIAELGLRAGVTEWGTRTTNYPLHIPLLIAAFCALFGEALPESKIIFPLYYLALLVLIFDFLKRCVSLHLAGWFTLFYAALPLIFSHASLAYANLPLTYALVSAVILAITVLISPELPDEKKEIIHPSHDWTKHPVYGQSSALLLLSSLFFVVASWTRPDGLAMSILAVIILVTWIYHKKITSKGEYQSSGQLRLNGRFQAGIRLAGPLIAYTLFWYITSSWVYLAPGWSQVVFRTGLNRLLAGQFNLNEILFVVRRSIADLFSIHSWGFLGIALVAILVLMLFSRGSLSARILLTIGLVCFVTISGMYILIANDPASNISWWIDTGLDRMLIPAVTLGWLGMAVWAFGTHENAPIS